MSADVGLSDITYLHTSWYRETRDTARYRDELQMANPYPIGPVVGVEVYNSDVVVIRKGWATKSVPATRSEVTEFSKASRQRLAFIASNTSVRFTSMLTLTYPREFPSDGKAVKRNLNTFLTYLKRYVSGLDYLWFLEFQKRGAPHIHLLLRGMRVSRETQAWVSSTWYHICATGDEKHLRAGTRLERVRKPDGARRYALKYAYKMKQKAVPEGYRNVGRFWGHSRGVKPTLTRVVPCTEDDLVGALQWAGWEWLKCDTIWYKVLYGASVPLTLWLERDILELSSSAQSQQGDGLTECPEEGKRWVPSCT